MLNDRLPFARVAIIASACFTMTDAAGALECQELQALTDTSLSVTVSELKPAEGSRPERCRVAGLIQPNIGFEVNLPTNWNGKFLQVGNGGFAGRIQDTQSYGLRRSYATAATDTGHEGADPSFALERAAEIDFGYRSIHLTQAAAKRLIELYYGQAPSHSYFRGCSTGGRQGLVEAQRFPADFDGIIAGAPIYDFSEKQAFNAAWVAHVLFGNDGRGYVPLSKLETLGEAVYGQCDALDGLEDGLIDDPRRCHFVPRRDLLLCADGEDADGCFTASQISAIESIYEGPGELYNRTGRYPGHVVGAEWMPQDPERDAGFTGCVFR